MEKDIQAFPRAGYSGGGGFGRPELGMTLRDYFAAKVLNGICSSGPGQSWTNERIAKEAYRIADAMMAERERASASK